LGVIPRALEFAVSSFSLRLFGLKTEDYETSFVSKSISLDITRRYQQHFNTTAESLDSLSIWTLVEQIFNQTDVKWDVSLHRLLAYKGLLYLRTKRDGVISVQTLFWPHFYFYFMFDALGRKFDKKNNALERKFNKKNNDYLETCILFQKLFPFPFPEKGCWQHFEKMALGAIVVRMRLAHHLGQTSITLKQLLCGAEIPKHWQEITVKVHLLQFVKEKKKWLNYGTKKTLEINDDDCNVEAYGSALDNEQKDENLININLMDCEYASLLCSGTSAFDGRIFLEIDENWLKEKEKKIVAISQRNKVCIAWRSNEVHREQ